MDLKNDFPLRTYLKSPFGKRFVKGVLPFSNELRHKQYHIFIMLFDHNQSGTDCGLYFGNDIFPLNKEINRRCVFRVVSRVMRKFDLALAEIYFRGRVHAPWLPSSGQGAKGQGRRYAARLALDAL